MHPDDPFAAPRSLVADPSGSSGAVSPGVVETLRRTKSWVRFLAVLGLIGSAFMLLFSLMVGLTGAAGMFADTPAPGAIALGYGLFMAVMAVLYVLPCVYLLRFAAGIVRLEAGRDAGALEQALEHQRAFWKFAGVVAIVMIALYVLLIVGAIGAGIFTAFQGAA